MFIQSHPAAELYERRQLRRSFRRWCEYRMSQQQRVLATHHQLICDTIEQLLRNELATRCVMFLMPPGSAKSTYTSVLLPSWFLNPEQHPEDLMLACSYSYTLIEGFGKQARDIVDQETNVLGIRISKTSAAAGDWRTTKNGGYFCAGVGAGIAGHRALLGLIDDYIGSEEEADSQRIRDKIWLWYHNDFRPRLWPQAWEIVIANRRHEDDLVGRLLNDDGKRWLVVRLPMLAEENDPLGRTVGERLWPEWFTDEQVQLARKLPRTWAGLYQQRPAPEEGNYFRKDWICEYGADETPKNLRIYMGTDYAVRRGEDNDRFCFIVGGVDDSSRLWIIDWWWQVADSGEAVETLLHMARTHRPICCWAGRENISGSLAPFLYRRMQETNSYLPIEELSEAKDKQAKAQSIRARMSAHQVMFPKFMPQWPEALHELLTFPVGLHDDFVDALAKLGQGLAKMVPASTTEPIWDGVLQPQLLNGRWLERSSARREASRSIVVDT